MRLLERGARRLPLTRRAAGSGAIIAVPGLPGGRGILTNAHCIADASYVTVLRHGSSRKSAASVAAVGHEADLALLRCDDPLFWDAAPVAPLPLGDVPDLQEAVSVVGCPSGGDNLSITRGVVSRVELTQYVHGAAHLLAVQLDAAINPGNSVRHLAAHTRVSLAPHALILPGRACAARRRHGGGPCVPELACG